MRLWAATTAGSIMSAITYLWWSAWIPSTMLLTDRPSAVYADPTSYGVRLETEEQLHSFLSGKACLDPGAEHLMVEDGTLEDTELLLRHCYSSTSSSFRSSLVSYTHAPMSSSRPNSPAMMYFLSSSSISSSVRSLSCSSVRTMSSPPLGLGLGCRR